MTHEYLINVTLIASIRIEAETPEAAIEKIDDMLEGHSINFGEIDSDPVIGSAVVCEKAGGDGPDFEVIEIDGEG